MAETKNCIMCWEEFLKKQNCSWNSWEKSTCCSRECSIKKLKTTQLQTAAKRKWVRLTAEQKEKGKAYLLQPWHKSDPTGRHLQEYRDKWWTPRNKWVYGYQLHGWFKRTRLQVAIRTSQKFLIWRKQIFERDNYTCQACLIRSAKGTGRVKLHAHHLKAFSELLTQHNIQSFVEAMDCKEIWDISNWQTLCLDCHKKTDSYKRNQNTII